MTVVFEGLVMSFWLLTLIGFPLLAAIQAGIMQLAG